MKRIETISLTTQKSFELTILMILLLFIGGAIFTGLIGKTGPIDITSVSALVVYVITLVTHELLHGFGFLLGGAKPVFGVGFIGILPFAYATSATRVPLRKMLFTAYLPFVVLSVLFVVLGLIYPAHQDIFMVGFLGNFTGAIGDLWIAQKLWKYLKFNDVMILDTKSGTEIYSNNETALKLSKKTASLPDVQPQSSWSMVALLSTGVILLIQVLVPVILTSTGYRGSYKLGFDGLYLFSVNITGDSYSTELNLLPGVAGGLLAGLIFYILTRYVRSRVS